MKGYNDIRAMGGFIEKYKEELIKLYRTQKERLTSFQIIARVISNLKFEE